MDIPVRLFGIATLLLALRHGVLYIALTEVMVGIFGVILYSGVCQKIVGYNVGEVFRDFGENVIEALMMGIVVWGFDYFTAFHPFITLVSQIILGAISYGLFSILFKNKNFTYLKSEILKILHKKKLA